MKIIVLGSGQISISLASILSREHHDITLVDTDEERLRECQNHNDLRVVSGHPAHPHVLEQAEAGDADILVALTGSDETNIVACQVAHTLFNVPKKVARIRALSYHKRPDLFKNEAIPIDFLISPEKLVSQNLARLIRIPGALQVVEFAAGKILLVAANLGENTRLTGRTLREFNNVLPGVTARVVAIYRNNRMLFPDGTLRLQYGDEVFFVAPENHAKTVTAALSANHRPSRKIIIAGGGYIGKDLAQILEDDHSVKIIEYNKARAKYLASVLDKVIVLRGDATSEEIMEQEDIASTDMFCALTSDDENNILSAMLAKRLGAKKVVSLISRPSYINLIQSGTIDIAISPQYDTVDALLQHIRRGDIASVHSMRHGKAEAIETIAHGDHENSKVVSRMVEEIDLPDGVVIGALVRNDETIMVHRDTTIESGDHIILFVDDKKLIPQVEKLFQVSATFF